MAAMPDEPAPITQVVGRELIPPPYPKMTPVSLSLVGRRRDEPCRILEIIAPGGFEKFFDELVDGVTDGPPEPEWLSALGTRYGMEFDFESIPVLCERFGITFGR